MFIEIGEYGDRFHYFASSIAHKLNLPADVLERDVG
jgi:hypothetical protein